MKCNNCGKDLPDDSVFCQFCGAKLSTDYNEDRFGLTSENPVTAGGIDAEYEYIGKLCASDGTIIKWDRKGSKYEKSLDTMVDIYEGSDINGNRYGPIYINMYGEFTETRPVSGFSLSSRIESTYDPKTTLLDQAFKSAIENSVVKAAPKQVPEKKGPKTGVRVAAIITSILMLVPLFCLVFCLNTKSIFSATEIYYFSAIAFSGISTILFIISAFMHGNQNVLLSASAIFAIISTIPMMYEEIWLDCDDAKGKIAALIITLIILAGNAIVQTLLAVLSNIKAFKTVSRFSIKKYEKLEKMFQLKEKGVITEEEYEAIKKDILK